MELILLQETDSTNSCIRRLAESGEVQTGTMVCALAQSAGRGQRGNSWNSPSGMGLYLSAYYVFDSVPADKQGAWAKAWAIAAYRYVLAIAAQSQASVAIKWPNDILVNGRKVGGMLIENSVRGSFLSDCIVGMGFNLNQDVFNDTFDTPAISMKMVTGVTYQPLDEARRLAGYLDAAYASIVSDARKEINMAYESCLFGIHQLVDFEHAGKRLSAVLKGVDDTGQAIIEPPGPLIRVSHPDYRLVVSPPASRD